MKPTGLADFGAHRRVVSVDPAARAGLTRVDLFREDIAAKHLTAPEKHPRFRARSTNAMYVLDIHCFAARRGDELRVARECAAKLAPMSLLIEAQYIGNNVQTAIKVIEARTRWTFAFELVAPHTDVVLIQAVSWQAGWMGLGSVHGREALKIGSDLAAAHAAPVLGLDDLAVTGDEADALNMLLWWLDHHLIGLPRKWARAHER